MNTWTPIAWLVAIVAMAVPPQQTFRASTTAVSIDVAVTQSKRAVIDLAPDDFLVVDNGVAQRVSTLTRGDLPLDVTVLVDVSASVPSSIARRFATAVRGIGPLLTPTDALALFRLGSTTTRLASVEDLQVNPPAPARRTALLDGIAEALMQPIGPGRRHLIVLLSDGVDTTSVLTSNVVRALGDGSEAVLIFLAVNDPTITYRGWMRNPDPQFNGYFAMMQRVADSTGGAFYDVGPEASLEQIIAEHLAAMRPRYVLTYVPTNVTQGGWHNVIVKVQRPGRFNIKAKSGYEDSR